MPNQDSFEPRRRPRSAGESGRRTPTSPDPYGSPEYGGEPPAPRRQPTKTKKRGAGRWIRAILMVLVTIGGCLFLALFILDTANDLFGLNQEDRQIQVVVPKGASNSEVAKLLEEREVIKSSWIFRIYADLKTKENQFQDGTYIFNTNQGYDEIILALKIGNYEQIIHRITFYEGETVRDYAQRLAEYNICDEDEFVAYLQTADFDYDFFNAIPNDPLRFYRLEGYLFPDTYDFFEGEQLQSIVRKFLTNFNDKVTDDIRERMMDMNLSVDETIILASIIQREAALQEDMRMVSSAFHNRLSLSETYPNLESDVTIFYVERNIKPYLQITNQDMYDAYNTYQCAGLPIGAISNPGMNAIRAALYPEESNYYFFVTDEDGNFYYATTLDEHNRNVSIAMASGGAHGIGTMDDED